ncbi:MAG: peptidoglycan-associated lipoprotein Pal, partial [Alphaproteobacteria bacterium]|nr:peptidoglycan-associated lipoprotein Pal [Alphaproteobacteria bacterium]
MKLNLLSLFAAVALVAACASDADQAGTGTGGGAGSGSGMGSSSIQPGSAADFAANVGQDRVFFDFDKSEVRADAQPVLAKWADWMKRYPTTPVTIEGHADERGTREYNLALGERRANSVRDFLAARGVGGQVQIISYGKERPAVAGNNDAAWSQNRRA